MGHPLKRMVADLGIPPARLNVSSFDLPLAPNRVLRAAAAFRTPSDQEVTGFCTCGRGCRVWAQVQGFWE
jgi:hypothetical protein